MEIEGKDKGCKQHGSGKPITVDEKKTILSPDVEDELETSGASQGRVSNSQDQTRNRDFFNTF